MRTFLVTPGAANGLHLSHKSENYQKASTLPDLSDGHGLLHGAIEHVALLASEHIEDLDAAITLTCGDIFVVGVETNAEGLLRGISQSVLVSNLDV